MQIENPVFVQLHKRSAQMEGHLCSCTSQCSPGRPYIRNRRIEHPEIHDCASRFLPVLAPPPRPRPPRHTAATAPGTQHPVQHTIYSFCTIARPR